MWFSPDRWSAWARRLRAVGLSGEWYLVPTAAVIGLASGLAAVGFNWLVSHSRAVSFGLLEWVHGPVLDGLLVVLLPTVGGLAVGVIQWYALGPNSRDHGVPNVIEALARRGGVLRPRAGVTKAITASLTLGSGGSAGVEGPIISIGSVLASNITRLLRIPRRHMSTLVGCGAAGATAAIFNAPIAGVIFALEVMLRDFSVRTFMPIVLSSVFAVGVTQGILGENQALFNVPEAMTHYTVQVSEIPAYALLGVLAGLIGGLFSVSLPWSEKQWARVKAPVWLRPAIGGLVLGITGVLFMLGFGQPMPGDDAPMFYGNGYGVIEAALDPATYAAGSTVAMTLSLVLAALVLKLVGTCLTLGSGGSGGIIAPSLFMGAMMGAAVGLGADRLVGVEIASPATYALAGMAGVVAATLHCPLTAFLLVFELTADYKVILPMMLVAIFATSAAQLVSSHSIYGVWLRQKGIQLGSYSDLTLLRRMTVHDIPLTPAVIVQPDDPATRLVELAENFAASDFIVCDEHDRYLGMVVGDDLRSTLIHREAVALLIVSELMRTDMTSVSPDETLDVVLDKFATHEVSSLAVVDNHERVKGVITRSRLMRQYQRMLGQRG